MLETTRESRRDHVRSQILEVAWSIARERGLGAISLRDVAAQVGMRAPSLYTYVASKEGIYDLMFAAGQQQLAEVLGGLEETGSPRRRMRDGARAFLRFCAADPARYLLMFQRAVPGFVPSEPSYALAVANLEFSAHALTDVGVTEPRHHDLWTSVLSGLAAQQLSNDPSGDRWFGLADEAVAMFCDHVGLPAEPDEEHRR
jgi:AcrR family transcriptional regulator